MSICNHKKDYRATLCRKCYENPEKRFWEKVLITNSCWEWVGSKNSEGYGNFSYKGKTVSAHRLSYEFIKGEIDPGKEIDHLCKNKSCVNPEHLESVAHKINISRASFYGRFKTKCKNGHDLIEGNIFYSGENRRCRICNLNYQKNRRVLKNLIVSSFF